MAEYHVHEWAGIKPLRPYNTSEWAANIREWVGLGVPGPLDELISDGKRWMVRHDVLLLVDGKHEQFFTDRQAWSANDVETARIEAQGILQNSWGRANSRGTKINVVPFPNPPVLGETPEFWDGRVWPFKPESWGEQFIQTTNKEPACQTQP